MGLLYFYTARDNCKLFHVSWYKPAGVSWVSSIKYPHTAANPVTTVDLAPSCHQGSSIQYSTFRDYHHRVNSAPNPTIFQPASPPFPSYPLPPAPPPAPTQERRIMALETLTAPLCRPARPCGVTSTGDRNKIHC